MRQPDHVLNMRHIGHSEAGGRGDGMQIMNHRGHGYPGHRGGAMLKATPICRIQRQRPHGPRDVT